MGVTKGKINMADVHIGYVDEFLSCEAPLTSPFQPCPMLRSLIELMQEISGKFPLFHLKWKQFHQCQFDHM